MQIWTDLSEVPKGPRRVVTIGNFDGVHRGHLRVVETCVRSAESRGVESVALTFDPHPRSIHDPGNPTPLIMSLESRLEALERTGLDAVFVAEYCEALYSLSARQFAERYLADGLGAEEVVVGEDFRFGAGNTGDIQTLRELGEELGFTVTMVMDVRHASGRRWSSSWVRKLLAEGKVDQAAEVLGHPYRLVGTVEHGQKRGRTLGFPTANLDAGQGVLAPADGVYAGWLVRDVPGHDQAQEFLPAAISVGTNPQFDGAKRTVEAHVMGRNDLDLYGSQVAVVFEKRLRPMMRFDGVDALLEQMDEDLRSSAAALGARPATRVPALG